jgi:PAS domain S-box-containing protein
MQKPEIPVNESDRLVALDRYQILDTLPEQEYDDLTQLAADICGTPIALISLVDRDRQWFKSRVGLEATETPRDISFCGHAVAANEILNIPDATQDPRFADNPLVVNDPNIRFYAGIPLKTPDNFTLGTLCVIDRQPRDLTALQIQQLEALSRLVISQLELRLSNQSLRLLASVVETSNDAIITRNLNGIITSWNPAAERVFGYSQAEIVGQSICMLYPPERLAEEQLFIDRLKRSERVEDFETIRLCKDGNQKDVSITISPLMDFSGNIVGISGVIRDISDRKQVEMALRESEEFNRSIFENNADCLKILDVDGKLTKMNCNGTYLMEIDDFSCWVGRNWVDTWQEPYHLLAVQAIKDAKNGDIGHFEGFCPTAKGTPKWWDVLVTAVPDADGSPLRLIATSRDITTSKQIEERLRKSDTHLKTAQRIVKLGSWEFDPSSGEIIWSDEVFRIFGRDPILGTPTFDEFQQYLHPDDRESHQQLVETSIANCQPFENEVRFYRSDGSLGYLQTRGEPVVDDSGHLILLIDTVIDITDRKLAEIELQNLSDRLNLAVKSGAIGIWDWNVQKNILIWDERMYELYGITSDQFTSIYDAWASSLHPDDLPRAEAAIQQALAGTKDYDPEFRVIHTDGSIRFIQGYALVKRNAQGEAIYMVGINFDITDRKLAETKLMQTTTQLTASNKELEAFAYSVSHDLRSPLRAIDGFSKALLEDYGDKFDEDALDYFDRIRRNVARMGDLIEDLLRLSRVSRSEMQYNNVNLSMLVSEQFNELQAINPERQVEIAIAPNVCVLADKTLMRVVISNLIQNAWKFTSHHPTARIEFGVISSENQQDEQLTYFVRDDGAGFDINYAKMLFGVFQRLHNTNEFAGTGIGLATVQRAIHRHGGRVWAEGAVEQGATIYFTVPNTSSQEITS